MGINIPFFSYSQNLCTITLFKTVEQGLEDLRYDFPKIVEYDLATISSKKEYIWPTCKSKIDIKM